MFGRTGLGVLAGVAALTASAAAETVTLNFVVTNTGAVENEYTFNAFSAPFSLAGPLTMSGSITGTVTDLNGNTATVNPSAQGAFIYTALIGGVAQKSLMDTGFGAGQFLSGNGGPVEFFNENTNVGSVNNQQLQIQIKFKLSAGDTASFTSIFTVVPAPGALVAMAGLIGSGAMFRRRRA